LDVEKNISAWKVDEKLGFQFEGIKREALFAVVADSGRDGLAITT